MKNNTPGKMSILQQIKVFVSLNLKLWLAQRRARQIDELIKRLDDLKKKEKEIQNSL